MSSMLQLFCVLGFKLSLGFRKYFCNSEIIFESQITNSVLGLENNFETQITNSVNLHRFVN